MKYAEVARSIQFAYELGGNKDLSTMIQRGISERTDEIRDYLINNEHRFLGSLVVAAVGGHAEYTAVEMVDSDGLLADVDREFGVLTFDGSHQFFALDGQHRLRAIKDAILKDPDLAGEDIGVIVVPHFNNAEGRRRTRRLFTNINRHAKPTSSQENIALDEDDGFAILTRRLLEEHPFLSEPGIVQVFRKQGAEGNLQLATRNVGVTSSAWTTIGVLYDILKELGGVGLDPTMATDERRASDEVLHDAYKILAKRLEQLLDASGDVRTRMKAAKEIRDVRSPKGHEADGHPMMRPIVQVQVARAAGHLLEQGHDWKDLLESLSKLSWKMGDAPWNTVFVEAKGTMISAKENKDLLFKLLVVHLAPPTKTFIDGALREYKALKGAKYPYSSDDLAANIHPAPTLPARAEATSAE